MSTYSFLDTHVSLVGPGVSISLGQGAAVAEEGITFRPVTDIDTMTIGADGTPMHSLRANKAMIAEVRLLKTSPINQKLAQAYSIQTANGSQHGQNTITLTNTQIGDVISCQQVAFKKAPDLTYAVEGGMNVWEFNVGIGDRILGASA